MHGRDRRLNTMPAMAADIAIIGAGPLGLATALALHRRGQRPVVLDARTPAAHATDARILALSHGSRELLELLNAWPTAQATPIRQIHVSQQGGLGSTRLAADEYGLPALGYVMAASALAAALLQRVQALGIPLHFETTVGTIEAGANMVRLNLPDSAHLEARLVACCEGSIPDEAAARRRDYAQHALLCRATLAVPHQHLACERFTAQGPIALLPCGADYAIVWTVPAERADALMAAPDAEWISALQTAIGPLAQICSISERARYPLGLRMRSRITAPRQVWLGNAAQTLHPVAGQGFNLALRDAWELADTLTGAPDPGAPELLARYARGRRPDREGAAAFTDLLVETFSSDLPLLPDLRGLGLLALDALPPLRHFVARRMIYGARAWP
ncbi:MAG: ubiH [Proteobacteria bacterium]|nr:ubiH [Pseudomonadota bacterium]